jgi:hypothetical protein
MYRSFYEVVEFPMLSTAREIYGGTKIKTNSYGFGENCKIYGLGCIFASVCGHLCISGSRYPISWMYPMFSISYNPCLLKKTSRIQIPDRTLKMFVSRIGLNCWCPIIVDFAKYQNLEIKIKDYLEKFFLNFLPSSHKF